MLFKTIEGCCSAVTMSSNPNFEGYSSHDELRRAIVSDMSYNYFEPNGPVHGVVFITNWLYPIWTRLWLKWVLKVNICSTPYRKGGRNESSAYMGFIRFPEPIQRTWKTYEEVKTQQEYERNKLEQEIERRVQERCSTQNACCRDEKEAIADTKVEVKIYSDNETSEDADITEAEAKSET